jgi:phosphoglycolate phosphatase
LDAVLFDLDGVLVDSRTPFARSINGALVAHGLPTRLSGTRAAIVGDRKFDISAGRAHGIATIGALWGIGSEAELREAGADLLAASPAQLAVLLG